MTDCSNSYALNQYSYNSGTNLNDFCTGIAVLQIPVFSALGSILLGGVLAACSWYIGRKVKDSGSQCGVCCLTTCAILFALSSFLCTLIESIMYGVATNTANYNTPGATCTITSTGSSLNALYAR